MTVETAMRLAINLKTRQTDAEISVMKIQNETEPPTYSHSPTHDRVNSA
jgi:hypothetical protein